MTPLLYTVKSGDSPWTISRAFGLTVEALLAANGLGPEAVLQIDQVLTIPQPVPTGISSPSETVTATLTITATAVITTAVGGPPTTQVTETPSQTGTSPSPTRTTTPAFTATPTATPEPVVHIIERGDTLGGLAVKYDVAAEEIAKANQISMNRVLRIGEKLIIPNATPLATPTPSASATSTGPPTPTLTITPSPSPTNTPLPDLPYRAPHLLAPTEGDVFEGEQTRILLNWTSVGILAQDEWYALRLWAPGEEEPLEVLTKAASWRVPAAMYPNYPEAGAFRWQVTVVLDAADTGSEVAISLPSELGTFYWR